MVAPSWSKGLGRICFHDEPWVPPRFMRVLLRSPLMIRFSTKRYSKDVLYPYTSMWFLLQIGPVLARVSHRWPRGVHVCCVYIKERWLANWVTGHYILARYETSIIPALQKILLHLKFYIYGVPQGNRQRSSAFWLAYAGAICSFDHWCIGRN